MRIHVSAAIAPIFFGAIFACTSSTGPSTIQDRVTGMWAENTLPMGGTLTLVLAAHDTTITGTGNYSIEAGRSGTVTVTGAIAGQNILLTVTYDWGQVAYFSGQLQGDRAMSGSWWTVSDPVPVSFRKVLH